MGDLQELPVLEPVSSASCEGNTLSLSLNKDDSQQI